jgi:ribulose-phosphate 3-epimerase
VLGRRNQKMTLVAMAQPPFIISPSLFGADSADLQLALDQIKSVGARRLHCDIMDGHFVPNLAFSPRTIKDIRPRTDLYLDVHLMTEKPEQYIGDLKGAGADCISFHIEACVHANRLARQIRSLGCEVGISLVPSTPIVAIDELLPDVDQVLLMSVNPGFFDEDFIPSCVDRIAALALRRRERSLGYRIVVDGGISRETAGSVRAAGADVAIVGRAFFAADDRLAEMAALLA